MDSLELSLLFLNNIVIKQVLHVEEGGVWPVSNSLMLIGLCVVIVVATASMIYFCHVNDLNTSACEDMVNYFLTYIILIRQIFTAICKQSKLVMIIPVLGFSANRIPMCITFIATTMQLLFLTVNCRHIQYKFLFLRVHCHHL